MIKQGVFLFILLLLICSCHPEEVDVTEINVDTPESTEVETTRLTGTIKNEFNQKISQASIEIYQNGNLIKTTNSDDSGEFILDEIGFSTDSYRLFVQKDGYLDKMDIFLTDELENLDYEVFLVAEGFEIGSGQFFPSDTSLIYVTGILTNNMGPLPGVIIFASDQDFVFFDYSISNSDGRFGFFAKKDEPLQLAYFAQCDFDPVMEPLNIGSFSQDTDIGVLPINSSSQELITLSGTITDCTSQPFNGVIYVYNNIQTISSTSYINVVDGAFDADIYICENSDEITLDVSSNNSPWYSEQLLVSINNISNLDIEFCDTPVMTNAIEVFMDSEAVSLTDITLDIDSDNKLLITAINPDNQTPFKLVVSNLSEIGDIEEINCLFLNHNDVNIASTQPPDLNVFSHYVEQEFIYMDIDGYVLNTETGLTHHIYISLYFDL